MPDPTARQEAIEALRRGYRKARDCEWFGEDEVLSHALDAIPAGVLARYAIERGGLERCGQTLMFASVDGRPREVVPVYRLVEVPDA